MIRCRQIQGLVASILLTGTTLAGCRTTKASSSQTASLAALPLTIAIAESILGELMQIGLELQWKRIEAQLPKSDQQLGEVSAHEIADTAKKLASEGDQKFREELKTKLNSLQDTLSRDFVAGSPDSNQLMAIMIDKANDIRNALESQATRADDPSHVNALSSYSSYLLVSSLSLAILTERATNAESAQGVDASVRAKLWDAVASLSKDCERHILRLNGPLFTNYAKTKLFRYDYETISGSVDFGFESDIRIRYCVTDTEGRKACGAHSQTVCKTELHADCVSKAREEASAALATTGDEVAMVKRARERFFALNLEKFAMKMVAKGVRTKEKASGPGTSGH